MTILGGSPISLPVLFSFDLDLSIEPESQSLIFSECLICCLLPLFYLCGYELFLIVVSFLWFF